MSKRFKDDFILTTEMDDLGHSRQVSTYIGSIYDLDMDKIVLNRLKLMATFLYIGGLASHIAAGFLAHSASNLWFVSIPYALAFLPIGLLGFALVRLPSETQNLKRYETEASFSRGRLMALFGVVLQIVSAAGLTFFLLLTKRTFSAQPDYLYLLLEVFAAVMFFNLLTKLNQVRIHTRADENGQKMSTQ